MGPISFSWDGKSYMSNFSLLRLPKSAFRAYILCSADFFSPAAISRVWKLWINTFWLKLLISWLSMERVGGGIWWIPPLPGATTKWPWKIGLISPYAYLCLSMTSCGSQWLEFPVLDKGVTDLDKHYEDDSLTNSPKNAYEDRKHNIP